MSAGHAAVALLRHVVQLAADRGPVAAGHPAGAVAGGDRAGQVGGRTIAGEHLVHRESGDRIRDDPLPRPAPSEGDLADDVRRDGFALDEAGFVVEAEEGGRGDDDVDDRGRPAAVGRVVDAGGRVGRRRSEAQEVECDVRAQLGQGARVTAGPDGPRDRVDPPLGGKAAGVGPGDAEVSGAVVSGTHPRAPAGDGGCLPGRGADDLDHLAAQLPAELLLPQGNSGHVRSLVREPEHLPAQRLASLRREALGELGHVAGIGVPNEDASLLERDRALPHGVGGGLADRRGRSAERGPRHPRPPRAAERRRRGVHDADLRVDPQVGQRSRPDEHPLGPGEHPFLPSPILLELRFDQPGEQFGPLELDPGQQTLELPQPVPQRNLRRRRRPLVEIVRCGR